MDPTTGVYRPEASTATPPKIDALLMTERSTGLYSWDGALLLGASFFLKKRVAKNCEALPQQRTPGVDHLHYSQRRRHAA